MSTQPQAIYLKDYTQPDFYIRTVNLHVDVFDEETIVSSVLQVERNLQKNNVTAPLVLNGEELKLESVLLDGKAVTHHIDKTHLTIKNVPNHFVLQIKVIIYPKKNTKLMGLYQSRNNLCTQCEAEGFRHITYFSDRPDVMSYFSTTIIADKNKYPTLLSNGNLIEEKMLDGNRHSATWEDPSLKPCYLFALVAGDFDLIQDQFVTMNNRTVDLYLFLEKGFRDQGDYAITALKKAMQWDEEKFGREYDLNCYMIVAVSDFNMGAMENKGLNIFNTKYVLAKPHTATDLDYINIERVIGHEYFHNWSGNRVTCRDWFQLTLKEGLTVLRDQLFTEDMTSLGVARIDVVNTLRNHQFPEDAGPMVHPIRPDSYMKIDNFYTMTVYEKGAEVIRMVRTLLTPEIFRKGMDLYFARYDGQAVTTEDFLRAMSDASEIDLTQFSRWYHQAGTPILRVKTQYESDKKEYHVTITQHCPPTPGQVDKLPFHLPFAMGLVGAQCCDLDLQLQGETVVTTGTKILDVRNSEQTFTFVNVMENPVPSFLRAFSAPVELQYGYSDEQLAQLMQCDSDPFARWEAAQRLYVNVVRKIGRALSENKIPEVDSLLTLSIKKLISEPMDDRSLLSRLLTLPSLKYLMTHCSGIDLAILYRAKRLVEESLANLLESFWYALFQNNQLSVDYVYDAHACGYRRLKNMSLYYLLHTKKEKYSDLAFEQALRANNMTDQLGALYALNDHMIEKRKLALDQFYRQYQHEPLVVNKWLALHASSACETTLEEVKSLLHHRAYDMRNPNNVYALLVTLGENAVCFHDKSGAGYALLAEQILAIDALNPQVSARIVRPLTQWKQMDAERGALMKAQLQWLFDTNKLSENLFEIVSKSLVY